MGRNQLTMDHILFAYNNNFAIDNETLYNIVSKSTDISSVQMNKLESIGKDGRKYSKTKREIRWIQQTLKKAGYLERVDFAKWQLTQEGKKKIEMHKTIGDFSMLAFSTKYGIAVWGDSKYVFSKIDIPITLVISSPPYPIKDGRAYGKWNDIEIVDFIIGVLEPVVKNLVDGGSVMLNLGNDVFLSNSPERSLWIERLIIALNDKLGLRLMDRIVWHNPQRPPTPTEYACKQKIHLASGYDPIIWMCNNPQKAKTDNRKILSPKSENYKKLISSGGEKRNRIFADGTHTIRHGSFSNEVEGSLPKNIYSRGHVCKHNNQYRKACKEVNIPYHGAMFPYDLVKHFISFATNEGDTVADVFGGSLVTASVAHDLKRNFIISENMHEYIYGGSLRFDKNEINYNPDFLKMEYLQNDIRREA